MKEYTENEFLTNYASEGRFIEMISRTLSKRGRDQRKNLLTHLVRVKEDAEEESFTTCPNEGGTEEEPLTTCPNERASRGRISHTQR